MRATLSALPLLAAIFLGLSSSSVHGAKIPFEIYPRALRSTSGFRTTSKLTYSFGASSSAETIDNKMDIRYTTNITINGKEVIVALDTGSTDLWVNPPGGIGQYNNTGIPLSLKYGDGTYGVNGTIGVAPFKFSSYEVPHQAFLHANRSTIAKMNELGIWGLLGLSFDVVTASPINHAIKSRYGSTATWGQSVLANIFDQHPDQPNFVALSLSRTDDLEDTQGGSFSIGEYNPTYAAVGNAPHLPQFPDPGDRWTTLLEGIVVEGKSIPVTSTLDNLNVPAGRGIALLDTGDPHAVFPSAVWDAIYSSIPSAVKYTEGDNRAWIIPCNSTTVVELIFGGQKFPIHPLDLSTISEPFTVEGHDVVACVSALRSSPDSPNLTARKGFEYSLGDSFLRNVYSAYHFGDSASNGKAYMQLLSRIDVQKAVNQVTTIRSKTMASLPPELPPATVVKFLNSATGGGGDGSNSTTSGGTKLAVADSGGTSFDIDGETVKKYGLIAIGLLAANLVVGLVLLVLAVLNCVRRGRAASAKKSDGSVLIPSSTSTQYVAVGLDDDVYPNQKRYGD